MSLQVLEPDCPRTTPYCFSSNDCSATCVDKDTVTCQTSSLYCPAAHVCVDSSLTSCPAPSQTTGNDVTYKVKAVLQYSVPAAGLNVYHLSTTADVIDVNLGDVIGYSTKRGPGRIATRLVRGGGTNDRIFAAVDTPSVGDSLNSAYSTSNEGHLLTVGLA